jgi:hypothetical protein
MTRPFSGYLSLIDGRSPILALKSVSVTEHAEKVVFTGCPENLVPENRR